MKLLTTRRRFLQTATGAAALGLADLSALRLLGAEPPAKGPLMIQFSPDIEPLVRLIEETPRKKCITIFCERLRGGLPYRQFLSAIFLAAVRKQDSHHNVYLIHSAHQVSLDLRPEERILPLFWAMDHYKWQQEKYPTAMLPPLSATLPPAEKALPEFHDAMRRFDRDRAEGALVALARSQGARQAMEELWAYGCRDVSFIGHRAIAVANCWRTMETIGWQHAEPVLRFVVRDMYFFNGKQDQYYRPNSAKVDQHLDKLPASWAGGQADGGATRELFALLREAKTDQACALACQQLASGVQAQSIWDAVHLAVAELMVRHQNGPALQGKPLHANTSANALRYAFATTTSPRTRLLILLQAVAWAGDFTGAESKNLRPLRITELEGAKLPGTGPEAVAEIFALLPARQDNKVGPRAAQDDSCRRVYALGKIYPNAFPQFVQAALSWLSLKAGFNSHEYKFPQAIFENAEWVSLPWRPHILAASAHYLHGRQSPDSAVTRQVKEELQIKG
jgi:hypothetical protein